MNTPPSPLHDSLFRSIPALSDEEITAWLLSLRGRPFVPGSQFDVSAVLKVTCGRRIYYCAGVNVENADMPLSIHGEGAALSAMLAALGKGAQALAAWVMAAPRALKPGSTDPHANHGGSCCGRCRQHLWEFAENPAMPVHIVALNGQVETRPIRDLLPDGFSFANFNQDAVKARQNAAQIPPPDDEIVKARLLRAAAPDQNGILQWLRGLEPVDYASQQSQSVVLVLDNQAAVAGVRLEDSAFTGMNAVQGAVANATTAFGLFRIQHAYVLTHGENMPPDALSPLPLSALQILRAFGSSRLPLTFFTPAGTAYHSNVAAMASYAPTFEKPYLILREGQLGT